MKPPGVVLRCSILFYTLAAAVNTPSYELLKLAAEKYRVHLQTGEWYMINEDWKPQPRVGMAPLFDYTYTLQVEVAGKLVDKEFDSNVAGYSHGALVVGQVTGTKDNFDFQARIYHTYVSVPRKLTMKMLETVWTPNHYRVFSNVANANPEFDYSTVSHIPATTQEKVKALGKRISPLKWALSARI